MVNEYEVGDVVQTTQWSYKLDGLYVVLAIMGHDRYKCHQIFCQHKMSSDEYRSFSAGRNEKIGHIDDISGFLAAQTASED